MIGTANLAKLKIAIFLLTPILITATIFAVNACLPGGKTCPD